MSNISTKTKINKSLTGKGVFPASHAKTLLIPLRSIFLSPRQLIQRLELSKDSVILEVGSGPGYFSKKIAREIPSGKLILADIQQEMLDIARKRLDKERLNNIDYYLCGGNNFEFQDSSFDRIFLVAVMGEVENQLEYCREFYRMLKGGGILSFSELIGDPDKLSVKELKELSEKCGFQFDNLYGSNRNYTINFKKPEGNCNS